MSGPRYSIVPGDFVDDDRPTLAHYKVLLALGRRTNRAGWCTISQTKLATVLRIGRQRINTAIRDLVEWGYVEKRGQAETHRNICFYRVILDRGEPEDAIDVDDGVSPHEQPIDEDGLSPAGDSGGDCRLEATHGGGLSPTGDRGLSPTGDTSVASEATPCVASTGDTQTTPLERPPSHTTKRAPAARKASESDSTPRSGRAAKDESQSTRGSPGWATGWTDEARDIADDMRTQSVLQHVIDGFLDGVRGLKHPPKGVDAAAYVRQLAARLREFDRAVLAETAEHMLDTRISHLPDAAEVQTFARGVAARRGGPGPVPGGDPALMARWPEIRAGLAERIGADAVVSWFGRTVLSERRGSVLVLLAPSKFVATRLRSNDYDRPLLAAVRGVFGDVTQVMITHEARELVE